jgi:hypothetical protein
MRSYDRGTAEVVKLSILYASHIKWIKMIKEHKQQRNYYVIIKIYCCTYYSLYSAFSNSRYFHGRSFDRIQVANMAERYCLRLITVV